MKIKKVKYIGFYDTASYAHENRVMSIAAVNKMNYIASAIVRAGYNVEIVSPSWSSNIHGFYKWRNTELFEKICLSVGPTFGASSFFTKKIRVFLSYLWLFLHLIKNVKKEEKIVVYHSMMALYPVFYAQKIKKFKIILELNEIYQDVRSYSLVLTKMEFQMIKNAHAHILSTELLKARINNKNDVLINYGNYRVEKTVHAAVQKKVHIVYAGIVDMFKGGALKAVEAAQFLSDKYRIHVIGFGNEQDIIELNKRININNQTNECKVTFEGLKAGKDYVNFISKCHIGLSTQSPDGEYNNSSFPSKILSYLSVGLRVVSVNIKAVKISKVGHLLYYYEKNDGRSIAETIRSIDMGTPYDSRIFLTELDKEFTADIQRLINS